MDYALLERQRANKAWATVSAFTLADCAAAPALFYADTLDPFAGTYDHLASYLGRLIGRPSVTRVLEEAQPYFALFPMERKPAIGASRSGRQRLG